MNGKADLARLSSSHLCLNIFLLITALLISIITSTSRAEVTTSITPSGTGSLGTTVTQSGNVYNITDGTRAGTNLFHSFGNFSVGPGDIANFLNTPVNGILPFTSNILGRVTEGNISNIFGTIQTTGFGNANLFLMNPAGFLFGPNANLNIGGILAFTTADYLRLADGVRFNAIPNVAADALLTASPVASFGFLGPNAASIAIQGGNLEVPDGQTLSFIGGPRVFISDDTGAPVPSGVTMTAGRLSAPNGLIYMETVTAPGEIPLPMLSGNPLGSPVSFSGSENAVIRIQGGEFVMKGASLLTATIGPTIGEPIGIDVEVAGQFTMQNVSTLSSSTTGDGRGGAISMSASTLAMDASSITSATSGQGTGANITVSVANLELSNGAQVVSRTDGPGFGGHLDVVASDHVTVAGIDPTGTVPGVPSLFGSVPSGLLTVASSTGDGGEVTVTTPRVNVTDGGHIGSFGSGDGDGGNLTLNVGSLNVTGGGQVWSSSGLDFTTFAGGGGSSGHITVNATDEIIVSGGDPLAFGPSQISSNAFGAGDGGRIDLGGPIDHPVPSVRLDDGGTVASFSSISMNGAITVQADTLSISGFLDQFGFPLTGGIRAESSNPFGQGGGISIAASSVNIDRGFILNTGGPIALDSVDTLNVTAGGQVTTIGAGAISITATDSVTVSGQVPGSRSRIESITPGDAANGGISIIAAKNVSVTDGGRINLEIGNQSGGQIAIDAESITIASEGKIRMDVGNGGGGQVQLTAKTVSLDQGSIQTVTIGNTAAGAINIDTTNLTLTSGSLITSQSGEASTSGAQTGAGGPIVITAKDSVQLSGGSKITSSALTAGNAGDISINAGQSLDLRDSSIKTEAAQASGGNIDIQAVDRVRLVNSTISTSVLGGSGSGGNITIDPNVVVLQNSQVIAQAVQGAGGNITITTPLFLADQTSLVSASSQFGLNGTVTIQSPTSNLSGSLGPLTSKPNQAQSLLTQRCAALVNGQASSFVVAGREQLPADPGSWLSSPLALAGIDAERFGDGTLPEGTSNLEPRTSGLLANDTVSLRRLTPAGFLIANFADSEATGCHS
jgi:filamentous hemagglutinin family protein